MATANTTTLTPQQMNAAALGAILSTSLVRMQQIFSTTLNPANGNVVNVVPRNVGLILGFFVDVTLNVANGATNTATLTALGAANALSNITFVDYANYTRHNTSGAHVHLLNTARGGRPFGLSRALVNYPVAYGDNWTVVSAPTSLAASATGTVTMRYYVPVAYGRNTLDGAVYANITNAQAALNLTINNTPFVSTGDATQALYSGNTGSITSATVTVYQHYRDQLPIASNGQPILPQLSLLNAYMLQSAAVSSIVANQDYTVPYTNFRQYLSTFSIFDNGGTLNAGSDVNYWALRSANFTDIFKMSPQETALMSRSLIGTDFPAGVYYFDHRQQPIQTNQYGNMDLVLNASTVNTGAQLLMSYEMLGQINLIAQAGSLPAGG